jgi:hypothetical protein
MLRMQEMAFPGFKFRAPRPAYPCMVCRPHVAFSHWYPPLIDYLTVQKGPFSKEKKTGKSLKKALFAGHSSQS